MSERLADAACMEVKMTTRNRRTLPPPPANRQVLSVMEAAGLLGVGESTLRDLVRRNEIPHTRFGKRILFNREILMGLMQPAPREERT
jgi:excisionase family DNA binding protein